MTEPLVYLNGSTLPASQARLAIYDLGVVMGATAAEMTRTFRRELFRLDEHLDRLFRSLRYARFEIGLTKSELAAVSRELVAHNAAILPEGGELGLVHFVTAGENALYAGSSVGGARTSPTVCAHTFALPFELWRKKLRDGVHLVTPSVRHVPPQCHDPKMKGRSRMHFYLADREAQLADPEAVALLLDLEGNVTETNSANFLMVEGATIISPTTRNTLPGVSRATVIELAARIGLPFVERDVQVFDVVNADEAFLTSTPYCLLPATKINGVPIGEGRPGPMFRRLLAAWSRDVGLDIEKQVLA
ncbi:MAG TPA: aminotransferase class IV [Pirellulales bacterium]|jgi:branched-chain amino acid aminotransferase|nr:aminotransferase class IV [Pirellulales bacterium]